MLEGLILLIVSLQRATLKRFLSTNTPQLNQLSWSRTLALWKNRESLSVIFLGSFPLQMPLMWNQQMCLGCLRSHMLHRQVLQGQIGMAAVPDPDPEKLARHRLIEAPQREGLPPGRWWVPGPCISRNLCQLGRNIGEMLYGRRG